MPGGRSAMAGSWVVGTLLRELRDGARLLAGAEEESQAPRVRQHADPALGAEAVGLVEALGQHPAPCVRLAVLAGEELTRRDEVLARPLDDPGVPGRAAQADELRDADQPVRVQVLVCDRRLVHAPAAVPVLAQQAVLGE